MQTEPRRLTIDQIVRELPDRMRQSIKDDLAAPDGAVDFLTAMYGRPVGYVYVARKSRDENGDMKWGPVNDGHPLHYDQDGLLCFGIGLVLERPKVSSMPTVVHFKFVIEEVTEDTLKLAIENAPGTLPSIFVRQMDTPSPAAAVTDWLNDSLKNPVTQLGSHSPIGFGRI